MATGKVRNVPYRTFLTLPVDDFPYSAFRVPEFTPTLLLPFATYGVMADRTGLRPYDVASPYYNMVSGTIYKMQ